MEVKKIEKLHLFSEMSHYVCAENRGKDILFKNLKSGESVVLSAPYVEKFLKTADQFVKVVKVGKEDKYWTAKQIDDAVAKKEITKDQYRVGDVRIKGIRTLWEEIHSTQVFTVCFTKQGAKFPAKEFERLTSEQRIKAIELIEKAKTAKKSMAKAYEEALVFVQENPISEFKEGEQRTLRGYKVQFTSRDGRYDCIDIDIDMSTDSARGIRPVNINTLLWLVFDGVKYEVE